MIHVSELDYGYSAKTLYNEISFDIETGKHCALLGSNGSGKSTLAKMIVSSDEFFFGGKIERKENIRVGFAGQFSLNDKERNVSVFEYLSEEFIKVQNQITKVCEEMAVTDDMEEAINRYQVLLDLNEAMDGDNYEIVIKKKLNLAGLGDLENVELSRISGGEYKVIQIMKEMLLAPDFLVLDEPDVFLDFANLSGLSKLINEHKGTLLVITHNRYLLNHCFDKILFLENAEIQEFDGNYTQFRCGQLREKLMLKEKNMEEQAEIDRVQANVDRLRYQATAMVNPVLGRAANARQSQLDRLINRQSDDPFIEIRQPQITLPEVSISESRDSSESENKKEILSLTNYEVIYDKVVLENVNFSLKEGEKVAIVGPNGSGKTSLVRDIYNLSHPGIRIDENTEFVCLSQLQGETIDLNKTVYEHLQDVEIYSEESMKEFLKSYCLEWLNLKDKVLALSVGEQNLFQIALMSKSNAEFLILDEPTSHLDIYAQIALEKAIADYKGTILMVSHDFYIVSACMDYVLYIEDNGIRKMSARKFRKMVYDNYFDREYLEIDRKKQEIELDIMDAYKNDDLNAVDKLCTKLESLCGII